MSLTLEPFIEPGSSAVLQRSSLWNPYEVKDEALPLLAEGLESELSPLPPTGRDDPRTLRASLRTHRSQIGTLNLTNAHHFTSQRRVSFEGALKLQVDTPDPSWAMARIDLGATLWSSVGERDQYDHGAPLGARSHEHVAVTATHEQRTGSASRQIIRMYLKELGAREHAYLTASPSLLTDFPQGGATGWSVRWGNSQASVVMPLAEAIQEFALIKGGPPTCIDDLFEHATEINVRGPSVLVANGFEITPGFVPLLNVRSGGPLAETLEEDFACQSTNPNLLQWDAPRTHEVTLVHELILRPSILPASEHASC